ncbi:MAG TPA: hypothetical protein VL282_18260 [Tepidisphaeraceae bacterium]|jgi:hypothetical protein|nr:hypothetical protein [Tepidisphaeraceae bacterium]
MTPILALAASTAPSTQTSSRAVIVKNHTVIVPHTDRQGHILTKYDPKKSFFPIGSWGQVLPDSAGGPYVDWKQMAAKGFNTIWPLNWDDRAIDLADEANLQLVYMGKIDDAHAAKYKNHPRLLANMWQDEPTGQLNIPNFNMPQLFDSFLAYKKRINAAMPGLPVFINDPPAIFPDPPKFKEWWLKWNTAGDVSCQDDYPIVDRTARTRTLAAEPTGIPQCVSLAIESNGGTKPEWLILAAFDSPQDPNWPFRMPTPVQLRAEIYTSIIHGATGVAYFIIDSRASRQGGVVGMSPDPKPTYGGGGPSATPAQLVQSKALWQMAGQINSEIAQLTPVLLSPTVSGVDYQVQVKGEAVTPTPLHCLLKPHPDGGYVLLTANVDDAVLNATFEFPDELKSVEPMFENQPPRVIGKSGRTFDNRYEPFEVRVYRITAAKNVVR